MKGVTICSGLFARLWGPASRDSGVYIDNGVEGFRVLRASGLERVTERAQKGPALLPGLAFGKSLQARLASNYKRSASKDEALSRDSELINPKTRGRSSPSENSTAQTRSADVRGPSRTYGSFSHDANKTEQLYSPFRAKVYAIGLHGPFKGLLEGALNGFLQG